MSKIRMWAGLRGQVRVCVYGADGETKLVKRSFFERLLGLPERRLCVVHHNIITKQGDALLANLLLPTPTKAKVMTGTGFMQVGTGWTGNGTKQNTRCNVPVGSLQAIDEGFPVTVAAFGCVGDNILLFRSTFAPGSLNTSGINELCLLNGNTEEAVSFAYAQLTPEVQVTSADTLIVEWEITFLGL